MSNAVQKKSKTKALRRQFGRQTERDYVATFEALSRSQAVIEFEPDGTILEANGHFLAAPGYTLDEIVGRHHRMFCDEDYVKKPEYQALWKRLLDGEFFFPQSIAARKKTAARSSSKRATTPSLMTTARSCA